MKNMSSINFFNQGIRFTLKNKIRLKKWIVDCIKKEKKKQGELTFVFCDDEYLLTLNKTHLKHNTYTDIITFDYSADKQDVSGDIFISIERVKENAKKYKVDFERELQRVMIHGVLHIMGYKDKQAAQKKQMRAKENSCLKLISKK